MSLRLDFDTSIASVLIEIYNNESSFHSELLENLIKQGKFYEYCSKEIEKIKDEVLSELNEKSRTQTTTIKEPLSLAIESSNRMAIFLSKSLCFVSYRTRSSLNLNYHNMMKPDDVRFSVDHKVKKPSEPDRLINTPIDKLEVCCINTNKLTQPRLDYEFPIDATHHRKTERVNSKTMRLSPLDNVESPTLGNKRRPVKIVRSTLKPKRINPLKSNDALFVKEKLILSTDHRFSLIQSTITASNRFEIAAKRPVASMEFFRVLFDMKWEKMGILMKESLLKSFLDKIQEVTINLAQPNSSAIKVQRIPKLAVSSVYLRNKISCNITIKFRGNKPLIFTSVPLTLSNNILQKCSVLHSVVFGKYVCVRQKGAYNRQERSLAVNADPKEDRLMTALRIFRVGSKDFVQLESVAIDGSDYKPSLVDHLFADRPYLPIRMSWIVNRHYMCDGSMNGDLKTVVPPNRCLHYDITKFMHIRSATDIFVNFPEIWAKICEPLPHSIALARVKTMNSVETYIVSNIKNHHNAGCEETWSDQTDNVDIWSEQVDNEIECRDRFDAGQYEFFTDNSEENENIESHEKLISDSHEKSTIAEEVDTNKQYNTENKSQHYDLETPISLAWSVGNSASLDDYMSEEDEVYWMFDVGQYAFFENANQEYRSIEDEYDYTRDGKVDDNTGKSVVFNAEQCNVFGKSTDVEWNYGRQDIKLENLEEDREATGIFGATHYDFFGGISEVNGNLEGGYEITVEDKMNENADFKCDCNTEDSDFFLDTWTEKEGGTDEATEVFDAGQYTFFDSASEMNENIESDDEFKWNAGMRDVRPYEFDEESTRDKQGKHAMAMYNADQFDFFRNAEIGDWNILGEASWNEKPDSSTICMITKKTTS